MVIACTDACAVDRGFRLRKAGAPHAPDRLEAQWRARLDALRALARQNQAWIDAHWTRNPWELSEEFFRRDRLQVQLRRMIEQYRGLMNKGGRRAVDARAAIAAVESQLQSI